MIWRCSVKHLLTLHRTSNQVIDERATLGKFIDRIFRTENIVINHEWSVAHFNEEVTIVVVINVTVNARTLGLPIQPCSQNRIVDVVVCELHINRRVQLNASNFPAMVFTLQANVLDMVIRNR